MFPLRDSYRRRAITILVPALVALNVVVFLRELSLGEELDRLLFTHGLVPARLLGWTDLGGEPFDPRRFLPLLTSMFLHGGWAHLGSNMLFLWVFGRSLEDRLGHAGFLGTYLLTGLAAAVWQVAIEPNGTAPMIGASGAIAGVLGAYAVLLPRARILAVVPIIVIPWFFEVRAIFFLLVWFGMQFFSGYLSLGTGAGAGVAWWAHIGGFVAGVLVGALVRLFEAADEQHPDRYVTELRPRRRPPEERGWPS